MYLHHFPPHMYSRLCASIWGGEMGNTVNGSICLSPERYNLNSVICFLVRFLALLIGGVRQYCSTSHSTSAIYIYIYIHIYVISYCSTSHSTSRQYHRDSTIATAPSRQYHRDSTIAAVHRGSIMLYHRDSTIATVPSLQYIAAVH